jgi:hypothetical protein
MTNARAARAWCLARWATRRRWRGTSWPSPPTPRGGGVRHRHRQHVRLLGLGRRPLLDGLGDRALADDRDRARALPRDARGLPRHGRALPHGAARAQRCRCCWACWGLVRGTSSAPRPTPCCPTTSTCALPGLPPAARHGEQRQARHAGRRPVGLRDRPDRTGASRAPTASTPSTSSSTRARGWSPATSSASPPRNPLGEHHDCCWPTCFAQTEALAFGKTAEEVAAEGTRRRWCRTAPSRATARARAPGRAS